MFTDHRTARLRSCGRLGSKLQIGAGALLTLMGVAMLTRELTTFSYWLLDIFPIRTKLG